MVCRDFIILENSPVAEGCLSLVLECTDKDWRLEGEFVDIAIEGFYLRRPLSVCMTHDNFIRIIYKQIGEGTRKLAGMRPGEKLGILTGLGRGFSTQLCPEKGTALLAGGGLGAAPLLLVAERLIAKGCRVIPVLGFNKAEDIVLENEFIAMCGECHIATMDGSRGTKGFVTDAIAALQRQFDCFYTCGPLVMMKAVCKALTGPGEASLEERMGCGAGFCYGCTIQTAKGPARVCKDGPVFNVEDIIW